MSKTFKEQGRSYSEMSRDPYIVDGGLFRDKSWVVDLGERHKLLRE